MGETTLFYIIIFILIGQYLLHFVLDVLNAKSFSEAIPEEVNDVFNEEEYRKSQAYKKTNHSFGLFSDGVSLGATLLFLFLGGFEWVDQLARSWVSGTIPVALVFFGIILLGSSLLSMPFSYYKTFVIEERFGFNKTSKGTFATDILKGWLLAVLLGGGVLALFIWFYQWAGQDFWL